MSVNNTLILNDRISDLIDDEIVIDNIRKTYINKVLRIVEYFNDEGQLHRERGPARIEYQGDGKTLYAETWYYEGKRHRISAPGQKTQQPAYIIYRQDGSTPYYQTWYIHGIISRENGLPAKVEYAHSGKYIYSETWYNENGKVHRDDDLPARKIYVNNYSRDIIITQFWFQHGKLHRDFDKGAAVIESNVANKFVYKEVYFLEGKKYRHDGVTFIRYKHNDTHHYFVKDKIIEENELLAEQTKDKTEDKTEKDLLIDKIRSLEDKDVVKFSRILDILSE